MNVTGSITIENTQSPTSTAPTLSATENIKVDFDAPVHVKSNRAGFWLIDDIISQGTYDIEMYSGPIYIEADPILKDITDSVDRGPITVCFHKLPTNLYLDSTNCGSVVERLNDWPAIYEVGNGTPEIILSNTGKAVIEVKSNNQ